MSKGYVLGSFAQDSDTGIKIFRCAITAGNFDCFNNPDGTNYQVPSGKKLTIVRLLVGSDAANSEIRVSYGDTAVDDAVGAPTNNVYMTPVYFFLTARKMDDVAVFMVVPALKYAHIKAEAQNRQANIWAIEEDE